MSPNGIDRLWADATIRQLLDAFHHCSDPAFNAIVKRYGAWIRRKAARVLHIWGLWLRVPLDDFADGSLSEFFLAHHVTCSRSRCQAPDEGRFKAWYTRLLCTHARRTREGIEDTGVPPPPNLAAPRSAVPRWVPSTVDEAADAEAEISMSAKIQRAIQRMSPALQEFALLLYQAYVRDDGIDDQAIRDQLGVTPDAYEKRKSRVKRLLTEALMDD